MNIELEEVVVMDVSDDALEQAAGGAQGGPSTGAGCWGPIAVKLAHSYSCEQQLSLTGVSYC